MRSASPREQPAASEMSPINASRRSAFIVTIASDLHMALLERRDIATVPGRADEDLVEADMLRQGQDVADGIAEVLRLQHARAVFSAHRHRTLVEDRRRDLGGADDRGADAVHAFLAVDAVAHRHHAVLGSGVGWAGERADEPPGPGRGVNEDAVLLHPHDRQGGDHAIKGARQIAVQGLVGAALAELAPTALGDVEAGIVHQNVEAAEITLDPIGDATCRRRLHEIAGFDGSGAARRLDAAGDILERRLAPAGEDDFGAFAREPERSRLADAGAGPGNPGNLPVQTFHLILPSHDDSAQANSEHLPGRASIGCPHWPRMRAPTIYAAIGSTKLATLLMRVFFLLITEKIRA